MTANIPLILIAIEKASVIANITPLGKAFILDEGLLEEDRHWIWERCLADSLRTLKAFD